MILNIRDINMIKIDKSQKKNLKYKNKIYKKKLAN